MQFAQCHPFATGSQGIHKAKHVFFGIVTHKQINHSRGDTATWAHIGSHFGELIQQGAAIVSHHGNQTRRGWVVDDYVELAGALADPANEFGFFGVLEVVGRADFADMVKQGVAFIEFIVFDENHITPGR